MPIDGNAAPTVQAILLTPRQAAEALAISPRLLWSWTRHTDKSGEVVGEIVATRIGRTVRYDVADLQKFVASHKPQPGAGGAG